VKCMIRRESCLSWLTQALALSGAPSMHFSARRSRSHMYCPDMRRRSSFPSSQVASWRKFDAISRGTISSGSRSKNSPSSLFLEAVAEMVHAACAYMCPIRPASRVQSASSSCRMHLHQLAHDTCHRNPILTANRSTNIEHADVW
jgi:hypothetical protein